MIYAGVYWHARHMEGAFFFFVLTRGSMSTCVYRRVVATATGMCVRADCSLSQHNITLSLHQAVIVCAGGEVGGSGLI